VAGVGIMIAYDYVVPRQNLVHSQNEWLGDGLMRRVSIRFWP